MAQIINFEDHVNELANQDNKIGVLDKNGKPIERVGDSYVVNQYGLDGSIGKVIGTAPSENITSSGAMSIPGKIKKALLSGYETIDTGIIDIDENLILKEQNVYFTENGAQGQSKVIGTDPNAKGYDLATFMKQAAGVGLAVGGSILLLNGSALAQTFGNVHTQFSLNDFGYGAAGSNDANINYFHTDHGIEIRNASGILTGSIPNPDGIYGLAWDGNNLLASNGSKIYGWNGSIWDLGLDISLPGSRDLGASQNNFFQLYNDGADIAVMSKTGGINHILSLSGILDTGQEGWGLYATEDGKEIGVTTDNNVYRLFLDQNNQIDSWNKETLTGKGGSFVIGAGYNSANGNLVLNDGSDAGKYANGPPVVPEPKQLILMLAGAATLGLGSLYKAQKNTK